MHDKARKNHLMSNKKRADKPFGYGKEISDAEFANVKSLLPYGK